MEIAIVVTPANVSRVRTFALKALALGVILLGVLAVAHRTRLFVAPWHEHSDYAINALQIERAGEFREIYGNQSRFGFFHPGPAFFYVYAAGEKVLFDWLHLVPSRYNAHLLAGLGLQVLFFTLALAVAEDWIRRPLFVPLALLAAAVHFGLAGNAFVDIWPPRVLLMPFLCLLVAGASVAAGRGRDLPWLVLAGCFLVHGHVAQPLFVGPVVLGAVAALRLRARGAPGGGVAWWRSNCGAVATSAACVAIFLVPLGLDLMAGAESNLARIAGFAHFHRGFATSWWRALLYFAGFLCYLRKPEEFLPDHQPGRADFIGEHVGAYFAWAGIVAVALGGVVWIWWRGRKEDARGARLQETRAFVFALTVVVGVASLLCLRWGRSQIGGMFEYNGYFYYGLLYAVLLLACAAVSELTVPAPRWAGALVCVAAIAVAWRRQEPPAIDYSTTAIPAAVGAALRADPAPEAPKYLVFGFSNWGEAASTALALQRDGKRFVADANWGRRFAPGATFEPAPPDFDLHGYSLWRISYLGPQDAGRKFRDDLKLYFEPLPLDPMNAEIGCGADQNLELYTLFGFASADGAATWTMRPYAGLIFRSPSVTADIAVAITAEPAALPGKLGEQPMTLSVNGREVFSCTLRARETVRTVVPAAVWNQRAPVRMVLHLPKAIRPEDYGPPTERRELGWHIEKIRFEAVR